MTRRYVYVWDKDRRAMVQQGTRRKVNAPYVISDTINPVFHHGAGLLTDSRSQFKRMTKASGMEERGPEAQTDGQPRYREMTSDDFERDTKIAYEQCKSGTAPLSEDDRELCRRIDQRIKNR